MTVNLYIIITCNSKDDLITNKNKSDRKGFCDTQNKDNITMQNNIRNMLTILDFIQNDCHGHKYI